VLPHGVLLPYGVVLWLDIYLQDVVVVVQTRSLVMHYSLVSRWSPRWCQYSQQCHTPVLHNIHLLDGQYNSNVRHGNCQLRSIGSFPSACGSSTLSKIVIVQLKRSWQHKQKVNSLIAVVHAAPACQAFQHAPSPQTRHVLMLLHIAARSTHTCLVAL
jgi:hypothetical protein